MLKLFAPALLALVSTALAGQDFARPHNGLPPTPLAPLWISDVTLHRAPGDTVQNAWLIVREGRVVYAGKAGGTADTVGLKQQKLAGKHIFPAFIDLYSSLSNAYKQPQAQPHRRGLELVSDQNGAGSWNLAIHPEVQVGNYLQADEANAEKLLKQGFVFGGTSPNAGIMRGESALVQLGKGGKRLDLVQSQLSGIYSFQAGETGQTYPRSMMGAAALMRQTWYDAQYYDLTGKQPFNAAMQAANSAAKKPAWFVLEVPDQLMTARSIADEFKLDLVCVATGKEYRYLPWLEREKTPLIWPALHPEAFDLSNPVLNQTVPLQELQHWELAPAVPALLDSLEVPFVLSTQGAAMPDNFFEHIRRSVTHGLHPDSALAALTTRAAKLARLEKEAGRLKAGFGANFVVASENLFTSANARVEQVFSGGAEQLPRPEEKLPEGLYSLIVGKETFLLTLGKKSFAVPESQTSDTLKINASRIHSTVAMGFENPKSGKNYLLEGKISAGGKLMSGNGLLSNGDRVEWAALARELKGDDSKASSDSLQKRYPTNWPIFKAPQTETVLFKNATIWPMSGGAEPIKRGMLLIDKGKVVACAQTVDPAVYFKDGIPKNFREVDASGMHITPGIIDEHSHIALHDVNEKGQASSAEVRMRDAINANDINIYRQLAGGVTTAQLLHGSANPIGGQSAIVKLRWGLPADELLFDEAPGFIKFALGENVKQSNWGNRYRERFPQTRMGVEQVFYDHFSRAQTYSDNQTENAKPVRGKKSPLQNPLRTDLELEALSEILADKRHITCHSYVESEIIMLMAVADSMKFKVNTFTHILEGYKVSDAMREHGAAASTFSDWWAYKMEVRDAIPYNAAALSKAGLVTCVNSDDPEMGRRLNQEAAKATLYGGLSEVEALALVTINPAKALRIDAYTGSLEAGKHADFVLWNAHPLLQTAQVQATYIDGARWFDRQEAEANEAAQRAERMRLLSKMRGSAKKTDHLKPPPAQSERHHHCDSL